jgi:hypothetical protein
MEDVYILRLSPPLTRPKREFANCQPFGKQKKCSPWRSEKRNERYKRLMIASRGLLISCAITLVILPVSASFRSYESQTRVVADSSDRCRSLLIQLLCHQIADKGLLSPSSNAPQVQTESEAVLRARMIFRWPLQFSRALRFDLYLPARDDPLRTSAPVLLSPGRATSDSHR